MARVLIVPCGCRGRALAAELAAAGHAVRGTTRSQANAEAIRAAGAEPYVGDPDRIGTLMDALTGVTIVCWLMGTLPVPELHEGRLRMLWEKLVDTPVRGVVYEGALPQGEQVARSASRTWRIPLEILDADPLDHDAWLAAARDAVDRLLGA
ncbi:MAG TPA: NAD(P)H-binding protein [Solirubrobacteraceae bacterium]|nr:NAD(P)H-binding protein [Solirubrobacteraceae bacterium]